VENPAQFGVQFGPDYLPEHTHMLFRVPTTPSWDLCSPLEVFYKLANMS